MKKVEAILCEINIKNIVKLVSEFSDESSYSLIHYKNRGGNPSVERLYTIMLKKNLKRNGDSYLKLTHW